MSKKNKKNSTNDTPATPEASKPEPDAPPYMARVVRRRLTHQSEVIHMPHSLDGYAVSLVICGGGNVKNMSVCKNSVAFQARDLADEDVEIHVVAVRCG